MQTATYLRRISRTAKIFMRLLISFVRPLVQAHARVMNSDEVESLLPEAPQFAGVVGCASATY